MKKGDVRKRDICSAAIAEFSERGYAGASMSNIASRAGISRPALYQYFDNKSDIFTSAFVALIEERVEAACVALACVGSLETQLDGFLQRYEGDLWQHMAASPFADEIAEVKDAQVAASVQTAVEPLWMQLNRHLAAVPTAAGTDGATRRRDWVDVLRQAPKGFKSDKPDVDVYRRRLSVLARSIAADIESTSAPDDG